MIFATGASANHGNSPKSTKSSRPPSHSQNPRREMFVTSASEPGTPCGCDFIGSFRDDCSNDRDLARWEAMVFGQLDRRLKPELRLSPIGKDMNVHPRLFAREESKSIWTLSKDRWTHRLILPHVANAQRRGAVAAVRPN